MKYWQGEGKHQKELKELTDKLIPQSGEAETNHGELLRLYNRFAYDVYNNGLCNTDSLGDLFRKLVEKAREIPLGSKAEYLIDNLDKLMMAIDDNDTKNNFPDYDCDCDIDEDSDNECYCDPISEQEEHWESDVRPLFAAVTEDDDGITELGDFLIGYVINIDNIIENDK